MREELIILLAFIVLSVTDLEPLVLFNVKDPVLKENIDIIYYYF